MSNNNLYNISPKAWGKLALGALGIVIILNLLGSGSMNYGYNMYYGRGMGIGTGGIIASILVLLVKLLWFVLVVSLVIGIAVVVKKNFIENKEIKLDFIDRFIETGYSCNACGTKVSPDYKFCPNCKVSLKNSCSHCGSDLKAGWKCCPVCGTGVEQ